jgi:hypothetical protein
LVTSLKSAPLPQLDPLAHKHLLNRLVFGHAGEYFKATCTLAPFSLTPMSFNTTSALVTLHLESNGYFPLFLEDYELNQELELSFNSFKLAFQRMSHKSASGL